MNHLENPGRVLLVDDNVQLLAGLSRNLRRLVPVVTASSGDEALTLLKKDRDFSIIISDMRMPGMDGAEFFSEAKLLAPDAVRILLTGQADLAAVVNAINHGRIYRFIAKLDFDELRNIVSAAMAHFRLQQEERRQREAIERSVIDRAEDLLALSSVTAWGRAARVRRTARALAEHLGLRDVLSIESVAVLDAARACFDATCDHGLVNAAVLSLAGSVSDDATHVMLQELAAPRGQPLRVGTRVVQVAQSVDGRAGPWGQRIDGLLAEGTIDERFATALRDIEGRLQPHAPHTVAVEELAVGMRLVEPLSSDAGVPLAPDGVRITPLVLARLAPLKLAARAVVASDLEATPEFSIASA